MELNMQLHIELHLKLYMELHKEVSIELQKVLHVELDMRLHMELHIAPCGAQIWVDRYSFNLLSSKKIGTPIYIYTYVIAWEYSACERGAKVKLQKRQSQHASVRLEAGPGGVKRPQRAKRPTLAKRGMLGAKRRGSSLQPAHNTD